MLTWLQDNMTMVISFAVTALLAAIGIAMGEKFNPFIRLRRRLRKLHWFKRILMLVTVFILLAAIDIVFLPYNNGFYIFLLGVLLAMELFFPDKPLPAPDLKPDTLILDEVREVMYEVKQSQEDKP